MRKKLALFMALLFVALLSGCESTESASPDDAAARASEVAESVRSGETVIPSGKVHGWSAVSEVDRSAMVVFVSEGNPSVPVDKILSDLESVCDHQWDVMYLRQAGYDTSYAIDLVGATFDYCQ